MIGSKIGENQTVSPYNHAIRSSVGISHEISNSHKIAHMYCKISYKRNQFNKSHQTIFHHHRFHFADKSHKK